MTKPACGRFAPLETGSESILQVKNSHSVRVNRSLDITDGYLHFALMRRGNQHSSISPYIYFTVLTIMRDDGRGICSSNRSCGGIASGTPSLWEETSSVPSCFQRNAYNPSIASLISSGHCSHAVIATSTLISGNLPTFELVS